MWLLLKSNDPSFAISTTQQPVLTLINFTTHCFAKQSMKSLRHCRLVLASPMFLLLCLLVLDEDVTTAVDASKKSCSLLSNHLITNSRWENLGWSPALEHGLSMPSREHTLQQFWAYREKKIQWPKGKKRISVQLENVWTRILFVLPGIIWPSLSQSLWPEG